MNYKLAALLFIVVVLSVGIVGCAPVRYVYQEPYQGVLTDASLDDGGYAVLAGSVVFDNETIVFGKFSDSRGEAIKELTLGATYKLTIQAAGSYRDYYYMEKVKDR